MRINTEGLKRHEGVRTELMYFEDKRERVYGVETIEIEGVVKLITLTDSGGERIQKEVTRHYFDKARPPELIINIDRNKYVALMLFYTKSIIRRGEKGVVGIEREKRERELRKGEYGGKGIREVWWEEDMYVTKAGEYRQIEATYRGEPTERELKLILEEQSKRTAIHYQTYVTEESRKKRFEGKNYIETPFDLGKYVKRYNEVKDRKGEIDIRQYRPLNAQSVSKIDDQLLYSYRGDSITVEKSMRKIVKKMIEEDIKVETEAEGSLLGVELEKVFAGVYLNITENYIVKPAVAVKEIEVKEGRAVYDNAINVIKRSIINYLATSL